VSGPERQKFDATVARTLADRRLQDWLADFQVLAQKAHDDALGELDGVEAWRDALSDVRAHTVAHLDHYLEQFAANVEGHGGHVFVAATAAEARDHVLAVARKAQARRIVKSKSMVTAEIELNEALEAAGVEVVETDLGEFIVQLTGEAPYHIIAPALHMTLDPIRELFSGEAGEELPRDADVLAAYARARLREKFLTADLGISGGNFGIASTGTVILVTNEGNGRLSTTLPRTHVVVMGIERLLPDWQSLDCALTLLTRAGTGQRISTYVSAITGPRREEDADGPQELHLVLVDNGRSRILGTKYEPVLKCIRCGSCADFCPVYGVIGGHAYDSVYTGPIGAVLTPLLCGLDGHVELPYASSLCGACRDACPARVPLTDLLLALRADAVRRGLQPASWGAGFSGYAAVTARPRVWDAAVRAAAALARPFALDGFVRSAPGLLRKWTATRDLRAPTRRSFRRRFRDADTSGDERR
jgi:L-lactate dehydrogenase complex protein LldF